MEGGGNVSVDDALAASGVDEDEAVLHLREERGVHHAPGLVREGQVQADDVGLGGEFLEAHEPGDGVLLQVGVVGDDFHTEGQGALRDLRGDVASADEAQGLLEQLGALQLALEELALLHGGVGLDQARGDGHHEGHGHFGHSHAAGPGRVDGPDAPLCAELLVHVVHAHAAADHELEVRGLGQEIGIDLGLGADQEDGGLGKAGQVAADRAEGGKALRQLGVEGVGDEDVHGCSESHF